MWCDVSVEFAHNFLSFPSNEFTIFSTILLMPFSVVFYGHDYLSFFILRLLLTPSPSIDGYAKENLTFFISGARFFVFAFNVLMKCNKNMRKEIIFSWWSRSRHIKGIFTLPSWNNRSLRFGYIRTLLQWVVGGWVRCLIFTTTKMLSPDGSGNLFRLLKHSFAFEGNTKNEISSSAATNNEWAEMRFQLFPLVSSSTRYLWLLWVHLHPRRTAWRRRLRIVPACEVIIRTKILTKDLRLDAKNEQISTTPSTDAASNALKWKHELSSTFFFGHHGIVFISFHSSHSFRTCAPFFVCFSSPLFFCFFFPFSRNSNRLESSGARRTTTILRLWLWKFRVCFVPSNSPGGEKWTMMLSRMFSSVCDYWMFAIECQFYVCENEHWALWELIPRVVAMSCVLFTSHGEDLKSHIMPNID